MTAELLIAAALLAKPSWCTAPVRVITTSDPLAYYDYTKDEIVLSTHLRRSEVAHAVRHEAYGHCLEDQYNVRIPPMFGNPPFVSEYASTNKFEDWAESVSFEIEGNSVGGRKARFIRRTLRQIYHEQHLRQE